MNKTKHRVQFVSLGPGDPELITLKALKALQKADVILTPSTLTPKGEVISRSRDVLLSLLVDGSKIVLFDVPMRKDRSAAVSSYNQVAKQADELCRKGQRVAITAEGDSGFYSSSQYINEALMLADVPTERIEGVPAFISCGALANIHVVKQEQELLVIPGETTETELSVHINANKSVVIMKASQCEEVIKNILDQIEGVQFHYFENVGVVGKEFYSTEKKLIKQRKFPYFSLLIIQKVDCV